MAAPELRILAPLSERKASFARSAVSVLPAVATARSAISFALPAALETAATLSENFFVSASTFALVFAYGLRGAPPDFDLRPPLCSAAAAAQRLGFSGLSTSIWRIFYISL